MTSALRPSLAALAAALVAACSPALAHGAPPATSGEAALVADARDGTVMHAENAAERRPIASATKLMTALLTLERADLDDTFPAAPYAASSVESQIGLAAGERMTVRDLLVALLLESANDAAVTLADGVAGSREAFVREMNRRAVTLGLRDTSYANPIGFDDPNNHSTARDLATLTRELFRHPEFVRIVDMPRATLESGARTRVIDNRNGLVARYPFVSGVKTGHTLGAGYVLVGSGEAGGGAVVTVTLGAPSESARDADTLALLRWGLEQFRRARVLRRGRVLARVDVEHRDEQVELGAARPVRLVLRRGERVRTSVDAPTELEGPLPAGEPVGWVEVRRGGETVRRVRLVTLAKIEDPGFIRKLGGGIGPVLTGVTVLGIVLLAMLGMRRRRTG
ncbi:MAG TPA: D-alanyl-D-alanine carboxypeptidase family protein [Thermoleophilaceae bacterium]|nr:D-alanyl-D-alanine carboxypeptidase family protein [Thermoleophilaceae bacterium]